MRLIDVEPLYKKTVELDAQALHMCEVTMYDEDLTEWRKWSVILKERSAFKYDLVDAPAVDAIPVEWIKKYAEEHHSCIQEFRYMLAEWAEEKDNGQTD